MHIEDKWDSDKKEVRDIVKRDTWYFLSALFNNDVEICIPPNSFFSSCKNETAKYRKISPTFGDIETARDYVERLKFEFDNEIMPEHFGNSHSLSIEGCCARFFPNPNNMEVKKIQLQHPFTHTSLMYQRKFRNTTRAHISFVSVFDGGGVYLLKEAPSSITHMATPNNTNVVLPSICSLFFVPTKIFALIRKLEHLAMVNI